MRALIAFLMIFSSLSQAREVVESKVFGDWVVQVSQDEWGDQRNLALMGGENVAISINPEFGFVIQNYNFPVLKDYWPYCEVTDFAYRVDSNAPVQTGMGGQAATGGSCASIYMKEKMLNDMRSGKILEVRAGNSSLRKSISLVGFSDAWGYAQSLCKVPIKVSKF